MKLAKKQNKNLDKLFEVIDILANGGTLEAKYRDHDLTGNYKGTRECHIEPDWLLIYEIQNNVLVLMLYRLGTHSELFKNRLKKQNSNSEIKNTQSQLKDVEKLLKLDSGNTELLP